jgi:hypothetical protein
MATTDCEQEPRPGFVILRHEWDGVHWDFMLDAGGTLRTWALEAFPVLGREIGGRALPDHRAAYLEYEGPIAGGRGSVRRVERGTYRVLEWTEDRVGVELEGDQVTGEAWLFREEGGEGTRWLFRLGGKVD